MNNDFFAYGLPVAAVVAVALIIWVPTVVVFIRRRQGDSRLTPSHLFAVLAGELAILLAIAAIVAFAGLQNAGGYLLAIALVIGAIGPHALTFRFRRDS
ncbi:MAG TPA: hypothetical protein VLN59_18515 [Burkholderiales bacterium]|nr:hypothetical protein [Burkholderiales bacterium]